jgi:formate dehydrogenase iron-sulfur subunit
VVRLWKGATKPLALGAIALAVLAGFLNYVRVGPKETEPDDERDAEREKEKAHG